MNGGILPIALIVATLGLLLSRATARAAWLGFIGLIVSAAIVSMIPLPATLTEMAFVGLWLSLIGSAALVFLARPLPERWIIPAAANAGTWAGALASLSGRHAGLAACLLLALLFIPGRWIAEHGMAIALKVAASWLIAIATLAIFVSLTPTPGYKPDHME